MISRFLMPLLMLIAIPSIAQKINDSYNLHIKKASGKIEIDGKLTEADWQNAQVATDFSMVLPMDTSKARVRTDVRMTYDDQNLYLIAVCFHKIAGPNYVESLRRDFIFGKNDNFLLFMDPFNDQINGFSFGSNSAGAQWDGTMYAGGSVDLNWDNKWISSVSNDEEKWIFEMAVPFTSIRFKKGSTKWGINFSRLDLKTTEKSSWTPVPRQFPTASLAFSGNLIWDQPPPEQKLNFSLIPYVLTKISKDHEKGIDTRMDTKFGGDMKFGVTSSLNLDVTINPDFSQVEVDRQVTNLDRFELFFPERRQFFLENGDLFANFGYATIRPFFSRRIGLGVPIKAGARLSGSLNKNWRIGIMDMQTSEVKESGLPQQNFAVMSLQRRVFSRSNIGFLFVNKQSINYKPDSTKTLYNDYNRNIGFEYNLASSNNRWTGKAMVLKSFTPGRSGDDIVSAGHLQLNLRKWTVLMQQEYVGKDFNAEVGYVPRNGYIRLNPQIVKWHFPKRTVVLSHGPQYIGSYFFDTKMKQTDHLNSLYYVVNFREQSVFRAGFVNEYIQLLKPFDPTNSGKDSLLTGSEHRFNSVRAEFVSKPQSVFTYAFTGSIGGYYADGKRRNVTAEIGYRFQPHVSLLGTLSYNNIQLPAPWNTTNFWLIGSQVDITFTNKIFFSTFFQYNEQLNNMNLNSRFQWRYKPASDLYIVYTDNYLPAPISVRNRAVVLKFTYWWNH